MPAIGWTRGSGRGRFQKFRPPFPPCFSVGARILGQRDLESRGGPFIRLVDVLVISIEGGDIFLELGRESAACCCGLHHEPAHRDLSHQWHGRRRPGPGRSSSNPRGCSSRSREMLTQRAVPKHPIHFDFAPIWLGFCLILHHRCPSSHARMAEPGPWPEPVVAAGEVGSPLEQRVNRGSNRLVHIADDPGRDRQAVVVKAHDVGRPQRRQGGRGGVKEAAIGTLPLDVKLARLSRAFDATNLIFDRITQQTRSRRPRTRGVAPKQARRCRTPYCVRCTIKGQRCEGSRRRRGVDLPHHADGPFLIGGISGDENAPDRRYGPRVPDFRQVGPRPRLVELSGPAILSTFEERTPSRIGPSLRCLSLGECRDRPLRRESTGLFACDIPASSRPLLGPD